jgi:hypothetical protein
MLLHRDPPGLLQDYRMYVHWGNCERTFYRSYRIRVDGEAKAWHRLARAAYHGLSNMRIQAYLTAIVINLKRLTASCMLILLMAIGDLLNANPCL